MNASFGSTDKYLTGPKNTCLFCEKNFRAHQKNVFYLVNEAKIEGN